MASKFATSCFTEVLYHENKDNSVRLVCVCPPGVNTPLLDQVQATVVPQLLEDNAPIEASTALDTIEKSLDKGEFWCFPGKGTKLGYVMRRLFPKVVWKEVHKIKCCIYKGDD